MKLSCSKQKKIISILVLLCVICTFVSSVVFVLKHTDHNCTGRQCHICLELRHISDMLKKIISDILESISTLMYLFLLSILVLEIKYFLNLSLTLVKLKVRLDD